MKCPNCGKEIADDSMFCEFCGTKISQKKHVNKKQLIIVSSLASILLVAGLIILFTLLKSNNDDDWFPYDGISEGHEWVDLGLSVNWATCNIGACTPRQYGDLFAWGETETKDSYTEKNYRFYLSGNTHEDMKFSKYVSDNSWGIVDNKMRLDPEDDVAHVKWGGEWRVPTFEEFDELRRECDWVWVGTEKWSGYYVTGKKEGYTDKYIFIPTSGTQEWAYNGYYMTSDIWKECPFYAYFMMLIPDQNVWDSIDHGYYMGLSVRPVCPKSE